MAERNRRSEDNNESKHVDGKLYTERRKQRKMKINGLALRTYGICWKSDELVNKLNANMLVTTK